MKIKITGDEPYYPIQSWGISKGITIRQEATLRFMVECISKFHSVEDAAICASASASIYIKQLNKRDETDTDPITGLPFD